MENHKIPATNITIKLSENHEKKDIVTSECDGKLPEQLGVHRILKFPAVGL